jgi:AcrR family transcriptional regulator
VPRVSDAHKEEVRRRILDAAHVCLERNGYRDITTRELLAEAGLSNGTLYKYFPTKHLLYEALAAEVMAADLARVSDDAAGGRGMGTSLLRFVRQVLLAAPDAAVAVSTFRNQVGDSAAGTVRRVNRQAVDGFRPLIDRAKAEGTVRGDVDADALVELLDLVWDGLGRREARATFATSFERVGDALVDLLVRGVLAEGVRGAAGGGRE